VIGTGKRPAPHAASTSPPAAEPPIPAATTTGGRSARGAGSGRSPAAVRHWRGKSASACRASWGSPRLIAAGSSRRLASLFTFHVTMDDGGREPPSLQEAAQLLDEADGAVASARAADSDGHVRFALALVRGERERRQ